MASSKMTKCKACGADIAKSAKHCPSCGAPNKKPIYKRAWFWVLMVFLAFSIIGASTGGDSTSAPVVKDNAPVSKPVSNEETVQAETEAVIEYENASVNDMMSLLEKNALKAKDTYDGKYLEITGKLSVIDSSGQYISIFPTNNDFAFVGVQCFVKNEDQKNAIMEMSMGDNITVRGKITNVGEVIGYALDITEFVK